MSNDSKTSLKTNTLYTGLEEKLKSSNKELGLQTFFAKIHPNDKCGANGLPLTPNSIRIYGRFQYLKTLKHINLCKYIDIERSNQQRLFVVIENYTLKLVDLLSDKYLSNIIMANTNLIYKFIYELLLSIKYLHEKNLVIRNLKLNNLLINKNGILKLTNYGLFYMTENGSCVDFYVDGNDDNNTAICSAPETYIQEYLVLNDDFVYNTTNESISKNYEKLNNPKNDVWSLGVLIFHLIYNINDTITDKTHVNMIEDIFEMYMTNSSMNGYLYLLNLYKINDDLRNTIEKRWKILIDIIKKCLELQITKRACLSDIILTFENEILTKTFTNEQIKRLFHNSNVNYDLDKIFESQLNRFLSLNDNFLNNNDNVAEDEPLLKRSIDEIYYLWRLVGGDFMSILNNLTKNLLKLPSIHKPYLLCKVEDSSEFGTPDNPEIKNDKIISIPLNNLISRLETLDKESYYVLINEDNLNDQMSNSDIIKITSKQPLSIRETDIEYQFHRLILFSRYLSAYPYKKLELFKECRIDIPPFYRNLVWATLLEVNSNVNDIYANIDKEQITNADRQIDVDIPRCHQYDALIASPAAHIKLKRVLKAWVVSNNHLTYWQGLDSLCAPFLYLNFNNEPLAYMCLHKFINKYASKFFLKENSTIIHEYLLVFTQLISFHDPELATHFENIEFKPDLYAIPWFLTMFAHIFPIQKILHLWDTLLLGSVAFPLCIGAAILRQLRKLLLNSDFNECILLFSELPEINIEKCVLDSVAIFSSTPKSCMHLQYLIETTSNINYLDIDEIKFEQRRLELFPRISPSDVIKLSETNPSNFIVIDIRNEEEIENIVNSNLRNIPFNNLEITKFKTLISTLNFPISTENDSNVQLLNFLFKYKSSIKIIIPSMLNFNNGVELCNELVRLGFSRICLLHNSDKCMNDIIKAIRN